MIEYLNKQAVLESISEAYQTSLEDSDQADWEEGYRSALRFVKRTIQSGTFDAPEMEHINAYWAREGLIKHQEAEVQRLRAALELCRYTLKNGYFQDELILRNALKAIDQALSTTTEPINAEKVERVREGDGNDA